MASKTKRPGRPKATPSEAPLSGPVDRISLIGFKSHRETLDIALKPITLLAGGNSSGKSSLLQPLLLMKQTLETPFEPPPLYLGGPCLTLDRAEELLWRGDDQRRADRWSVGLHHGELTSIVTYRLDPEMIGGLALEETRVGLDGAEGEVVLCEGTDVGKIKELFGRWARVKGLMEILDSDPRSSLRVNAERCAHVLEFGLIPPDGQFEPIVDVLRGLPSSFSLDSLIYLPGLRDGPERSYEVTGVSGRFPGRFPEYTASLLHHWQQRQDPRLQGVVDDLRTLALADQIHAQKLNDRRVEIRVSRRIGGAASDMVNIADVGVGVSQVLPIVVALRAAGKDQIVHIEQPELHLHPRAEIALASLFVAAARRGARLVLETHSSTLLRAFQAAVAEDDTGWVRENLALHWFARDASGESKVTTAEVQADGSFGDWPVDLNVVEMDMARRLLIAGHARRARDAKAAKVRT